MTLRISPTVAAGFRVLVCAALLAAVYRVAIFAWADAEYRSATPEGLRRAENLAPSNPLYHYANALLAQQRDPDSKTSGREFAAAVQADPRYTDALLAWSVDREMHGDRNDAERLLQEAEQTNHLLRPAWALANYYFRQGMTDQLLTQAREALRIIGVTGISEGRFNPYPIYQLLWASKADKATVLAQGIPDNQPIMDFYLGFVSSQGDLPAAEQVADKLLPNARLGTGDPLFLFPFVNTLIEHDQLAAAEKVWRGLYERKMVPYPEPDVANGVFVTNGTFGGPPLNFGFDWRKGYPDSIAFSYLPAEHAYHFDFSDAPEAFQLIVEILPLKENASYSFRAHFRADFDPERSGLRWELLDRRTGSAVPMKPDAIQKGANLRGDQTVSAKVSIPSGMTSGNLRLSYARQPGTVRVRGYYEVSQVDLQLTH